MTAVGIAISEMTSESVVDDEVLKYRPIPSGHMHDAPHTPSRHHP